MSINHPKTPNLGKYKKINILRKKYPHLSELNIHEMLYIGENIENENEKNIHLKTPNRPKKILPNQNQNNSNQNENPNVYQPKNSKISFSYSENENQTRELPRPRQLFGRETRQSKRKRQNNNDIEQEEPQQPQQNRYVYESSSSPQNKITNTKRKRYTIPKESKFSKYNQEYIENMMKNNEYYQNHQIPTHPPPPPPIPRQLPAPPPPIPQRMNEDNVPTQKMNEDDIPTQMGGLKKKSVFLLFPVHLFSNKDYLKNRKVYMIEDETYFTKFKYHKLKLVYHRASMKNYVDECKKEKIDITYIDFDKTESFYKKIGKEKEIECYDMNDIELEKKIKKRMKHIHIIDTLNFTVTPKMIDENKYLFETKTKTYRHDLFYQWQRKRLDILMTSSGKPKGGKWSFDKDNRKPLPDSVKVDFHPEIIKNKYYEEAKIYIEKHFKNNYGEIENTIYPINHKEAKEWLNEFLKSRFKNFGKYEDAETTRNPFLFHSILTPMMNIGLLTDFEVLEETKKYEKKVSISDYEGFIRQLIGWRNYIYTLYLLEGKKLKKSNYMKYHKKLNIKKWWNEGEERVGIEPIDYIINKIRKYGYAHHIERLMYLGNFMFLLETDPNMVYKMFMEWTIDAYEWVMVPNVYGMSQYADGGKMMTRPYFSSSNYILKMSDFKRGEWCKKWDTLYYGFIGKNRELLKKNYATAQQVVHWDRKTKKEKDEIMRGCKKIEKELR